MRRVAVLVVLIALTVALVPAPAAADDLEGDRVELQPIDGTQIDYGGRRYRGVIGLTAHPDGVAVVETARLDDYLAGIREVPFSWPDAALRAQAVAARTYLAWTLNRGRSTLGTRYDYDICATQQCQVYAGAGVVDSPDGPRWLDAVESTGDQILLFEGVPAQTLYSASAGSRTRANQDVWGSEPLPYLQPVDSPETGVTPYEAWILDVPVDVFARVLEAGGYVVGPGIGDVRLETPGEGNGVSRVVVDSAAGRTVVSVSALRAVFNRHGRELYPGMFPGRRPEGGRWPSVILSYSYDVAYEPGIAFDGSLDLALLPAADVPPAGRVSIGGEGWGHAVGLSQWGAKAMADLGFGHEEILAHYYGGLAPEDGGEFVPEAVRVGLANRVRQGELVIDGPVRVGIDGSFVGVAPAGLLRFTWSDGDIRIEVPLDRVGQLRTRSLR